MHKLILVNANRNGALLRRTIEAELEMQKNTTVGLSLGVLLLALLLAGQTLLPQQGENDNLPKDDTRIFVPQPPPNFDPPKLPALGGPKVPKGRTGTLVPVAEADLSLTLTPQDSLTTTQGTENGSDEGWSEGNGEVGDPAPIDVPEDPEPPPFLSVEREPVVVRQVTPTYPEILLKAGIQGRVVVSIWVNKDGRVHKVRLLQADNELFNEAAIEAAKRFLFTPAYMNDGPVSVWVNVPFAFRLK